MLILDVVLGGRISALTGRLEAAGDSGGEAIAEERGTGPVVATK